MVMRLDLKGTRPAIPNIDDARVLSRSLNDAAAACGQALEMNARRLVGAVLAPHHAEDSEFGERWLAAKKLQDLLVFVWRDSVIFQELGCDLAGGRYSLGVRCQHGFHLIFAWMHARAYLRLKAAVTTISIHSY